MTTSLFDLLTENLRRHEGLRLDPYKDTVGKLTIGYGRNLEDKGISKTEAEILLSNDAREVIDEARTIFDNIDFWTLNRQYVVCNMLFNMGKPTFLEFVKMISALEKGNFQLAAKEMLDSKWAAQVGYRAQELAFLMEAG